MILIIGMLVLIIILVAVLVYLVIAQLDLRTITNQLHFINYHTTNQQIRVHSRHHEIVALTQEIDTLLNRHQAVLSQSIQSKNQLDLAIHNISHDLRTPLTVASGYAQLLKTNSSLSDDVHQQVFKLDHNLALLTKHLDLLLLYNRLIENRITITPTPVNVSARLQEACLNVYDALQQRDLALNLDIQPQLTWSLDEEAMTRIFQNILGNILDHASKKATITLKQIDDTLVLTATNQLATPIKDANRLIDRFYTEDLSHQKQNAGLGLYIISELTQLQHGTVSVTTHDLEFKLELQFKRTN